LRPLRVLHLHLADTWGGNLAGTLLVCRGLVRAGVEVWLAAPEDGVGLERFRRAGINLLAYDSRSKWDLASVRRLAGLIEEQRIDLVHSHLRPLDWLLALTRPLVRCVRLTTIHAFDVNLDQAYRPRGGLKSRLYRWVLSRGLDRVLTVSAALRRDAVERLGLPAERVSHVVNGLDLEELTRSEPGLRERTRAGLGLGPDQAAGLMVGEFGRRKGQARLIRAAAPLIRAGRLKLILVGGGPDLEACRALAQREGLAEGIVFTGFQGEIKPYLAAADLACLPSLSEGLPRSLMEAMAWGRPAVASNLEGVRELVDERVGLLVEPEDEAGLGAALAALVDDPQRLRRLGRAARERVWRDFDARAMVAQNLAVYEAEVRRFRLVSPAEAGLARGQVKARKAGALTLRLKKRRLEGLFYRGLSLVLPRPPRRRPPDRPRRVALIYRGMALGDLACCTPLSRAVKERFPGAEVALLVPERLLAAARLDSQADRLIAYPDSDRRRPLAALKALGQLRAFRPEAAVALGLPFLTCLVTRLSGAAYTLGYNYNRRGFLLQDPRPPHKAAHRSGWEYDRGDRVPYAAEHWAGLMSRLTGPLERLSWDGVDLGRAEAGLAPVLAGFGLDRAVTLIGLHPRAAQVNRSLTFEQTAYLARRLKDLGRVVLTGGPADAEFGRRVAAAAGPEVVSLAGRLSLGESWALTRNFRVLISVDTGLAHLAAGLGRPVISLFTQGDPLLWAPYQFLHLAVQGDPACLRCKSGRCFQERQLCLESLDLARAVALAREIVGQ